jgi:hypothetical protein
MSNVEPIRGAIVFIKTNWAEYLAILKPSCFGGYEFHDCHSPKIIQTTVVTGWKPIEQFIG